VTRKRFLNFKDVLMFSRQFLILKLGRTIGLQYSLSLSLASRPPDGIVPNDREWHCPALSLFGRYILTLLFTTDFCALRIVLRAQYTPYIPLDEDKYFIFFK
jgi:hypothetical protein